jgi:D-alanine-D-alanine ligase
MKKLTVAVLMGGISAERKISLASGKQVIEALRKSKKYEVRVYDPKTDLIRLIQDKDKIDLALPILHGPCGEDGTIQGLLELLQIPYGFSNVLASALGMNKLISRKIFESAGLLVPKYIAIEKNNQALITLISNQIPMTNDKMTKKLDIRHLSIGYFLDQLGIRSIRNSALVIKPNTQGSSVGVSICYNQEELEKGLKEAFKYDETVIVEEYIKGIEITGGVLGQGDNLLAFPIVEIVPKKQFFNYQAKYNGTTEEIIPARISKQATKKAQEYAKKAHQILGCSGVTRTDMIIRENSNSKFADIRILEINTIPGLTKESLIPKAAKAAGISFEDLLDKIINLALRKATLLPRNYTLEGKHVSQKT